MRSINLITLIFLAGAHFSGLIGAHPTATESQLQSRNPDPSVLDARGLTLQIAGDPTQAANCPLTTNGPDRIYIAHSYTVGQIKAAFRTGSIKAANGEKIGANNYPHDFGNKEALPFNCGTDKMEFPIQTDGNTYNGGATDRIPDRVIFEYDTTKTNFVVKYCGIIRHGPTAAFLGC